VQFPMSLNGLKSGSKTPGKYLKLAASQSPSEKMRLVDVSVE